MTTTAVDIYNRALSEIGARASVVTIGDQTPQAVQCSLWYDTIRRDLLRSAAWGFSRKTVQLTSLGLATDTPNIVPYPWVDMYEYPSDCVKFRYVIPPPVVTVSGGITPPNVGGAVFPTWGVPSRAFRYLVSQYTSSDMVPVTSKVLLSNVVQAYGVYTADVTDIDLMDESFINALTALLASKIVMPLTGNAGMVSTFFSLASQAVLSARVNDGNEAIPSTDHEVDWITTRGLGGLAATYGTPMGQWYSGWDNTMNWGM